MEARTGNNIKKRKGADVQKMRPMRAMLRWGVESPSRRGGLLFARRMGVERPDMLPESEQGQGAYVALGLFSGFLGGAIWHFMGIDERRVNNHLCKIDEFRMFVAPASRLYGIQTLQKHDGRPWGFETNIARVQGGRGYITTICYRKSSKDGTPVPNVEDYKVHLIPR